MASLKALKIRINSVKSTQKITKAMKMVAAAKLRRAQDAAEASRPYAERLEAVVSSIASKVTASAQTPKLLGGTGKDQVHLIVVATSERGLAGAFNTNIVRAARKKADALIADGKTVKFYIAGKKGRVLRRFYPTMIAADHEMGHIKKLEFDDARAIADDSDAEGAETVGVMLSNPRNLTAGTAPQIGPNGPAQVTGWTWSRPRGGS